MDTQKLASLKSTAHKVRALTIEAIGRSGKGHMGGSLSIADVLTVIFHETANIDPKNPRWEDRDRFVLSKAHAGPGLYATLTTRGFFPEEWLWTLNQGETDLPSHCDMNKTPGVDMTAGSLGQGLSAAVGMAVAGRISKKDYNVYCIMGDGELGEGQIWEAAMFAGHHKLNKLIGFIDYNHCQIDGTVEEVLTQSPLDERWASMGWEVVSIDGHDIEAITDAINAAKASDVEKPHLIILNTIKGKGIKRVEGQVASHSMSFTEEQWKADLAAFEKEDC